MPPRTPAAVSASIWTLTSLLQSLPSAISRPQSLTRCSACMFSTTAPQLSIKKKRKVRKHIDPYRAAQARQRKAANLARQAVLRDERAAALGDPVRSQTTPFMQSLKNPTTYSSNNTAASSKSSSSSYPAPSAAQNYLNYFLKPEDVTGQLEHSKWLTEPVRQSEDSNDPALKEAENKRHEEFLTKHDKAQEALKLITSLDQASSKDLTRINIQRCIEEFGRHKTDDFLPSKPASILSVSRKDLSAEEAAAAAELAAMPKRVGPDTGSSEVQIAILTAKINVLADDLHKQDKQNKRNLRLLVHRRQKLLKYLRRKERGGPRWQHLVEKLGISDAMWKGEISL